MLELLEQHDLYHLGDGWLVSRRQQRPPYRWVVYCNAVAVEVWDGEVAAYPSVMMAVDRARFLMSLSREERLEHLKRCGVTAPEIGLWGGGTGGEQL